MAIIETVSYSPGVKVREIDKSAYALFFAPSTAGVVGTSYQGRTDKPVFISTITDLISLFGIPRAQDYGLWACVYALQSGMPVIFKRIVASDAAPASVTIPDSAGTGTAFVITAKGEGAWGNDISVEIAGIDSTSYKMTVKYKQAVVHHFDYVSTDVNSKYYIDKLLENSDWVSVSGNTGSLPGANTYTLAGGSDGTAGVSSAEVQAALNLYSDKESFEIDLLAAPGWSDDTSVGALVNVAESRADCVCLVDPPAGLDVTGVKDWVNGVGLSRAALNTSYGAVYYPWVSVIDNYNGGKISVPPSSATLYVFGYNDRYGYHLAPAGLKRGMLPFVVDAERKLALGDREVLQSPDARVNPIVLHSRYGAVVWGQRTLQTQPTSLDRLNVRRYLIYLGKSVAALAMNYVFEQNTSTLWKRFATDVAKILEYGKQIEAISAYSVKCDEETNSPAVVANNTMRAEIYVVPVKSAEKIWIDVVLSPEGADLTLRS